MSERIADDECEGLVRLIVESYRDAPNPSVDIAVEEIMRTFYDYAHLSSPVPAPPEEDDMRDNDPDNYDQQLQDFHAVPAPEEDWMLKEMVSQASLGHKLFCVGIHQYDSGEVEEEWIEWSEAFDQLVSRLRSQVERMTAEMEQQRNEADGETDHLSARLDRERFENERRAGDFND